MFFGLFQTKSTENEDDVATGTFADGMIGTPLSDPSARPRERSKTFRRNAYDRDYGAVRMAGQMGAGLVP
ncbi:hypothetical protein MUO32_05305 [Shinella sp. CPCC 101442]|uniref:hypothetical protein n=1 Tax=Shinella sp. CPCC 101442 TaxID=2932265 RepID=UPI002153073A|nr:hypothetical protein [Shinella sp. CPCC 101442]MCR6498443.1 hypothetical protein [Shinella sp. CPCC 101442]